GGGVRRPRERADRGARRGHRGHTLVTADPVRRHLARPDRRAVRPARPALGGAPMTSSSPAMTTGRWSLAGLATLVAVVIPLVISNQYTLSVMVTTGILLVLNISWNFVLGVAGVWNFGQLALYALGG